jgi:hypothetical protein
MSSFSFTHKIILVKTATVHWAKIIEFQKNMVGMKGLEPSRAKLTTS